LKKTRPCKTELLISLLCPLKLQQTAIFTHTKIVHSQVVCLQAGKQHKPDAAYLSELNIVFTVQLPLNGKGTKNNEHGFLSHLEVSPVLLYTSNIKAKLTSKINKKQKTKSS